MLMILSDDQNNKEIKFLPKNKLIFRYNISVLVISLINN